MYNGCFAIFFNGLLEGRFHFFLSPARVAVLPLSFQGLISGEHDKQFSSSRTQVSR
jgi:hypothetical protein